MKLIERKIELDKLPQVGDNEVNGERLYVQATGVRIRRKRISNDYYLALDKKYFIAKDVKGNYINVKIVKDGK